MKNILQNQVTFIKSNKWILVYWDKDSKILISTNNKFRNQEKICKEVLVKK